MGHRSVDLRDGTLQDIMHICSSMEQLLLSYRPGEIPYIYVANFLELLFQSARTRICVLREPVFYDKDACAIGEVDKLVVFSTFRKCEIYRIFLKQLSSRLLRHKERFLEQDCERLEGKDGHFYICLARVYPENQGVIIDRSRSKEAYHRLATLLRLLVEESKSWGMDIQAELYRCFSHIPDARNATCKLPCDVNLPAAESANYPLVLSAPAASQGNDFPHEDFLRPIYEWVDYIYSQSSGTPLVQVAQPGNPQAVMDYSNLFFFVKVNTTPEPGQCRRNCDSFEIRLVCPPQQQQELSRFYHHHRENQCQWHVVGGHCKVSGMGKCLFTDIWTNFPEQDADDEVLLKQYAPVWEKLSVVSRSDYSKSEMAFRSSSILFDRRKKRPLDNGFEGRVNGANERDRVAACVTYRMMMPVQEGENCEDQVPQIMFVPIYAGAAPFVLAATVVNAQLPEPLHSSLSEWRRSYLFAGMAFQFMASRLKETARKAYLNKATDMVQDLYESCQTHIENHRDRYPTAEECLLDHVNNELDTLAKAYPYHKIILAKSAKDVINKEGRDVFETPGRIMLQVSLEPNPYWCQFSDKCFFTAADVARKFRSGMARNTAFAEWEMADWHTFYIWHIRTFKFPPQSKDGWQKLAKEKDWDGSSGDGGNSEGEDGANDAY